MILLKLQTFTKYSNEGVFDRACLFLALGCNGVDSKESFRLLLKIAMEEP